MILVKSYTEPVSCYVLTQWNWQHRTPLDWFTSCLSGHTVHSAQNLHIPTYCCWDVTEGVSRGSVLGPPPSKSFIYCTILVFLSTYLSVLCWIIASSYVSLTNTSLSFNWSRTLPYPSHYSCLAATSLAPQLNS